MFLIATLLLLGCVAEAQPALSQRGWLKNSDGWTDSIWAAGNVRPTGVARPFYLYVFADSGSSDLQIGFDGSEADSLTLLYRVGEAIPPHYITGVRYLKFYAPLTDDSVYYRLELTF